MVSIAENQKESYQFEFDLKIKTKSTKFELHVNKFIILKINCKSYSKYLNFFFGIFIPDKQNPGFLKGSRKHLPHFFWQVFLGVLGLWNPRFFLGLSSTNLQLLFRVPCSVLVDPDSRFFLHVFFSAASRNGVWPALCRAGEESERQTQKEWLQILGNGVSAAAVDGSETAQRPASWVWVEAKVG